MIEVAEGGPHDVASIMPIMADAFDPEFGEAWTAAQCLAALSLPGSQLLMACNGDGTIIGFAITRWVLDEEELLMIAVGRDWQRQNVASRLLNSINLKSAAAARVKLFLEVREDNPARLFYAKAGFAPIGRRKGYYLGRDGTRRDAITMQQSV